MNRTANQLLRTAWTILLFLLLSGQVMAVSVPVAGEIQGGSVTVLLLFVTLAIGMSFLCSVAEAVLLSITPSYIESQKEDHPARALRLRKLRLENVDQSLAAILTLNTIAHTVGAVAAGAEATKVFGSAWVGVFSAVLTLLILFVSEIIPKTLGAVYWSSLVSPTAAFVRFLILSLYPLVWLSERLTRVISQNREVHSISRDELRAMASVGAESGLINQAESKIIHNLFRFSSLRVTDIMTPRTVMTAAAEGLTVEQAWETLADCPFSRIPVYREHRDEVTGFILRTDLLDHVARDKFEVRLVDFRRELLAVPVSVSLLHLFEQLLEKRQHLALVVDEYGGTKGLVTLEDLVETLTGMEIMDETDRVEDMRALARRHRQRRAKAMGMVEPETIDDDQADGAS